MQTGASAGRLLYIYLNGKPLLISDEIEQRANTFFTVCTDHFRMHQSFQMSKKLLRSASSHVNLVATTKTVVWLSLPPLPPKHAMCCAVTAWVPQSCRTLLWSDDSHYRNISTFFYCCELWHTAQQPWGGGWSLHPGAEAWGGQSIWTSFIWWWWAFGSAAMQYI